MLRFDHMASDFNDLFLFLGDSADLGALASTLRSFAEHPRLIDIGSELKGAVSRSKLSLVPEQGDDGDYGLKHGSEAGEFRWGLNAWQAEQIAVRIDLLLPAENKSGNDIFELGVEGEIPVKVSRGEFEDEFLIRKF